jgi:hypothetical protein
MVFSYKVEYLRLSATEQQTGIQEHLNKRGSSGWELVRMESAIAAGKGQVDRLFVFKKKRTDFRSLLTESQVQGDVLPKNVEEKA